LQPHRPLGWIKRALLYQSAFLESSLEKIFLISQSISYGKLVDHKAAKPPKDHWNCGCGRPHGWL
ncbi:MAG TPA: hypothetical protein PKX75_15170, partial [Nitrospira sp.]|nr:hypothetical protein [Nitrospira sp.]